jgi:Ni,Fe-hydrogenase maturation factor
MAEYLLNSISCKTVILGIQPAAIKFNSPVSREIKAAVKALSRQIKEALCISTTKR